MKASGHGADAHRGDVGGPGSTPGMSNSFLTLLVPCKKDIVLSLT